MGYPFGQRAYKLLNIETHQMFTFGDVVFHEQVLPYHHSSSPNSSPIFPQFQFSESYYPKAIPSSQT